MKLLPALLATLSLLVSMPLTAVAETEEKHQRQQLTSSDQVPEGLQKSDWRSIRAAHEAWQHGFMPVEGQPGTWQARNPGQQWTTTFDGRGFLTTPKGGVWTWGLELEGVEKAAASTGTHAADKSGRPVLSFPRGSAITEWFINDQRGLEQGWTLSAPAEIRLRVRGSLKASVSPQSISFGGQLTYSGLKAWDATGKTVPTHFEATAQGFAVRYDDTGAQYPITIDPIAQQAYLKPAEPLGYAGVGDEFGSSVAVSGDTVVVGAPLEDSSSTGINNTANEGAFDSGAAYVFVRSGTTWSQQAYLKASQVTVLDRFGTSVAVSGDTVVVGAYLEDSSTTGINSTPNESASAAGAAYVFVRSGTTWNQQAYLKASQVTSDDQFGVSVAVSGDTVVVGASGEDSNTTGVNSTANESVSDAGAAYVFVRSGTTWSQQAYFKAAQVTADDEFGYSVAVSGDTVVVGAQNEDGSTTGINSTPNESAVDAGAAYVFVRSGTTWSLQAYLKASQVTASDLFGRSVAVSGDTVVVGSAFEDSSTTGINSTPNESTLGAGAAYVFVRSGTTWNQQAYLKASQVSEGDGFGTSVAVSGDTVVVGASGEDSSNPGVNSTPNESSSNTGAAYVFVRSGTTWSQQAYLKSSQVTFGDNFGLSVAVSVNTVVVGAYFEDSGTSGINSSPNESAENAGAAYAYVRSGTTWSQQAYVKPSAESLGYAGAGDGFGRSVSVSGDTVVVGASGEDSNTTGINSTPNESASSAGAVYVFVRNGTTWSQQAYLKPAAVGTTQAGDDFGVAVSVSGDTVVVGASGEDSNTTGINSTPNESASSAGAVYVFVRNGTTWSQQAYLKPAAVGTTQADDSFGISVSVSGDTVVVGASGEDSNTTGINSTPNEFVGGAGAAYVFVRSGTAWNQQAYLKPASVGTSQANDQFGISVSVSGDTVVVGANGEDSSTTGINSTPNEATINAGAAYVFARSGITWSQQAYLKPAAVGSSQEFDNFGISVSVSGDTAVVGAIGESSSTVGINSTPNEGAGGAGAAYVYVRSGTTWSQQAYLKPAAVGTSQSSDSFGRSASVSGDTVVVGAYWEDSSTTGINSTPNESASFAGAAYVFVRSGTAWSQQAYLKASQVTTSDNFGSSVAVSNNTVVIGVAGEDSSTMVINSTPNEGARDAGAAYIFTITPDTTAPLGGTMTLSPASPFDPATALTVSFSGWMDDSTPLGYAVLFDNAVVSPQGSTASRNLTAPTTPGTYTLKGRIYDALNNLTEVTQSFTVNTPQQSLDLAMTAAGLSGPGAAFDATPQNDGVENLLKYAFNMNLTAPDVRVLASGTGTAGLPTITSPSSSIFRFEFLRRKNSGLVYTPKKNAALTGGSWVPLTDTPTVTAIDATWERVVYEEPHDPVTTPRLFGIVEVSLP